MQSLFIFQPITLFIATGLPFLSLVIISKFREYILDASLTLGLVGLNVYNQYNVDKWVNSNQLWKFSIFGNIISTYFWTLYPIKQNINLYFLTNPDYNTSVYLFLTLFDFMYYLISIIRLNHILAFYSIYCNQTFEYSKKYKDQF